MTDPEPQIKVSTPAPKCRAWKITGAVAALLCVVMGAYIIYIYGRPTDPYARMAAQQMADAPDMNHAGLQEWRWASADHEIIATAVAACSKAFDLGSQPGYIRAQLRVDTGPDGRNYAGSPKRSAPEAPEKFTLSNFQRAAIYLSDAIARARFESGSSASANHARMLWFQIAIVGIGAITTILISIKSISNPDQSKGFGHVYFWIGIAAIVFSSVGTATSALNSFYGPRESYLKNERSLSALRQLHGDIAGRITSTMDTERCGSYNPLDKDSPYGKQVQEWTARLGAIVSGSDSGSASSGASNAGGSAGGGGTATPTSIGAGSAAGAAGVVHP